MAAAAKDKAKKAWTIDAVSTKATVVALHLIGFVPVYIAADINYHAAVGQGPGWAKASVCFTILAAVLIEAAVIAFTRRRMIMPPLVMVAIAIPFLAFNTCTATGNAVAADVHAREVRQKAEKTATNRDQARKEAEELRDQNKRFADGETAESAQGKIDQLIAKSPMPWARSKQCGEPRRISAVGAEALCDSVAKLRAKAKAATAYQTALADLKTLNGADEASDVGVQATTEGAAANLLMVADVLGATMTKEGSEKVFEWSRGANLELAASVAPGLMTFLAWLLFGSADAKASTSSSSGSVSVSAPPKPRFRLPDVIALFKRKEVEPVVTYAPGTIKEFHRRFLEQAGPNDRVSAADIQKRFKQYREDAGGDKLTGNAVSRELRDLGLGYEKMSGHRSYYHGAKWRDVPLPAVRPKGPHLAVDNTPVAMASWG